MSVLPALQLVTANEIAITAGTIYELSSRDELLKAVRSVRPAIIRAQRSLNGVRVEGELARSVDRMRAELASALKAITRIEARIGSSKSLHNVWPSVLAVSKHLGAAGDAADSAYARCGNG